MDKKLRNKTLLERRNENTTKRIFTLSGTHGYAFNIRNCHFLQKILDFDNIAILS